ncbi:predicted protein [Sclerotinia sclerotiorum 1980 UF-70]|uniref:Uncharacterized protein n=1 Tax=Sclerotinia sclerotiorum (strain ATCC 18683 / 1980 / Ss-1) TaxID=665079 RepID=A7E8Z3_SCLS1|nr:predicted protein [Sclerotinia sclerotiorum 1980 UF-70]EDN96845.1 predicted protein [Sclerotinia sclerotiorum 1980 UF-70]
MHQAKIQPIQVDFVPLHTIKRIPSGFICSLSLRNP